MSELLWPDQPVGRPIAGTIETVSHLSRSELYRYVQAYYHPKNILVTVCGDIRHSEIESLTERYFNGRVKKPISKFKPATNKSNKKESRIHFLDKKTEQTHFVIGFHGLSRNHPDRYALSVLNIILGGNMSSRLFEEVREKRGLAYEIKSGLSFLNDTGAISVSAGVEPKKAPLAARIIMKELSRLKRKPVTVSELRRAKDYFLGQLMLGLEDTLDHALWYGERMLYGGDLPDIAEIRRQVEGVNEKDIQSLSQKFFKTDGIHLSLIGPVDSQSEIRIKSECICP
ncbi:MAG: hypothetical protein A3C35_06155 [Omnitrophica bacterium RIFCSPHIGHO2_02_FULL_46_11]|nr:MAG: hypothetical protein A3C35_06155 [Omnitrophica bacterium RIFCSPHIGHO2_02_FULL_46_11]